MNDDRPDGAEAVEAPVVRIHHAGDAPWTRCPY